MTKFLKMRWPLILLIVLAVSTRFWYLSSPPEVVFDEVHFGKFVSGYFNGEYFFDIHPPAGKLLIAGFSKLVGFKPQPGFHRIGEPYDARDLLILRFLPALFGVFLILMAYLVIIEFGFSEKAALFGASLMTLDNAFLVQSKFILMDSTLLFFGVLALYFSLRAGTKSFFLYGLSGVFAGLAAGVKFTGLSFTAVIFLGMLVELVKTRRLKKFLFGFAIFTAAAAIVYIGLFYLHFALLPHSGPGDAFMSRDFQRGLVGNAAYLSTESRMKFVDKFFELNKEMYRASSGLTATHPDGSIWSEWPRGRKPIFYWTKKVGEKNASIYLMGNPVIWWLALTAVAATLLLIFSKKARAYMHGAIFLLPFGYFINLLPFMFIKRVAFLYHYMPSMVFGILILAAVADFFFFAARGKQTLLKNMIPASMLALSIIAFIFLMPISYGFISPWQEQLQSFITSLHG